MSDDRLDREGLATWLFQRSHEPSFSDDAAGMQDARDTADYLLEVLGVCELQAENERLREIGARMDDESTEAAAHTLRVLAERDAAREQVRQREAEWVAWLVEVGYPFDFNTTPPPPVDAQALADRWNEADDWQVAPQQALDCILAESSLAREKGSDDDR